MRVTIYISNNPVASFTQHHSYFIPKPAKLFNIYLKHLNNEHEAYIQLTNKISQNKQMK